MDPQKVKDWIIRDGTNFNYNNYTEYVIACTIPANVRSYILSNYYNEPFSFLGTNFVVDDYGNEQFYFLRFYVFVFDASTSNYYVSYSKFLLLDFSFNYNQYKNSSKYYVPKNFTTNNISFEVYSNNLGQNDTTTGRYYTTIIQNYLSVNNTLSGLTNIYFNNTVSVSNSSFSSTQGFYNLAKNTYNKISLTPSIKVFAENVYAFLVSLPTSSSNNVEKKSISSDEVILDNKTEIVKDISEKDNLLFNNNQKIFLEKLKKFRL